MPSPTKLLWELSYCIFFKVFLLSLNDFHSFLIFQLKSFCFQKADFFLGAIKYLPGRPFEAEKEELKFVYSKLLEDFFTTNNSQ